MLHSAKGGVNDDSHLGRNSRIKICYRAPVGAEARCTLRIGRKRAEGKALLETDALIFHGGEVRLSVPYNQMFGW